MREPRIVTVTPSTEIILSTGCQLFGSGGYYCQNRYIPGPAPIQVRDGIGKESDFISRRDGIYTLPLGCIVEQYEGDAIGRIGEGRTFRSVRYVSAE